MVTRLYTENRNRVSAYAEEWGQRHAEAHEIILDTFDCKRIDMIIRQLKKKYKEEGFTANDYQQLSILFTLLRHILQPVYRE